MGTDIHPVVFAEWDFGCFSLMGYPANHRNYHFFAALTGVKNTWGYEPVLPEPMKVSNNAIKGRLDRLSDFNYIHNIRYINLKDLKEIDTSKFVGPLPEHQKSIRYYLDAWIQFGDACKAQFLYEDISDVDIIFYMGFGS